MRTSNNQLRETAVGKSLENLIRIQGCLPTIMRHHWTLYLYVLLTVHFSNIWFRVPT